MEYQLHKDPRQYDFLDTDDLYIEVMSLQDFGCTLSISYTDKDGKIIELGCDDFIYSKKFKGWYNTNRKGMTKLYYRSDIPLTFTIQMQ